ncbi:hypothetical protein ACP70R_034528 [Stipagrostis hirtigluma subsp. patula]
MKEQLLAELENIDQKADSVELTTQEWEHRYNLEEQLEKIYEIEEQLWQRRGGENWILKGDANTGFFPWDCQWKKKKKYNLEFGS